MSKSNLVPVTGANNLSAINDNFQKIGNALDDMVLYRDNPEGEPNQLKTDLDVNSQRIYNLPKPQLPSEPIRLADIGDVTAITEQAAAYAQQAEDAATQSGLYSDAASQYSSNAAASATQAQQSTTDVQAVQTNITDVLVPQINGLVTAANTAASNANTSADRAEDEADRAEQVVHQVVRLFEITAHNGGLDNIPVGFIPASGQVWYANTYPEAAAALEAGKQFVVSEVTWQASDTYKGCWSSGGTDATGRWYRAPKLNADTGYRAPFLRGSQIGIDAGKTTDDRIRDITGSFSAAASDGATAASGAFVSTVTGLRHTGGDNGGTSYSFAASRVVPTGPENSPRYHGVIMCIRMFGTVNNPGSLDAAQLATDLAVANAKIAALQNAIGFTIIYPNGGTAATPGNVVANSRYIESNPFTGAAVICEAQILINGEWHSSGWFTDTSSASVRRAYGCRATQSAEQIIVQTGASALVTQSAAYTGGSYGAAASELTTAQCRVKVWKVKA